MFKRNEPRDGAGGYIVPTLLTLLATMLFATAAMAQPSIRLTAGPSQTPLPVNGTYNLGSVLLGTPLAGEVQIHNDGDQDLIVTLPFQNLAWPILFGPLSSGTVSAGTFATLGVTFGGDQYWPVTQSFAILSNDPSLPSYGFTAAATGVADGQIRIVSQEGVTLQDGGVDPDAFEASVGGTHVRNYTIHNDGTSNLVLTRPWQLLTGNCTDFEISSGPTASTIGPGASGWFQVSMKTATAGPKSCTVEVYSNDDDPNPLAFDVQGTVGTVLSSCGESPGLNLDSFSLVVRGLPASCDGTDAYNPNFPNTYQASGGPHNKCGFNVPVISAAYTLVADPDRSGPNGNGDVLDWWMTYLRGEMGMRSNWHFGGLELFSGIYEWYNEVAVLGVHYHAQMMANQLSPGHPDQPRYDQLADLARIWIRATVALQATAAIPVPQDIRDELVDGTFRDVTGANPIFAGNDTPATYLALAGMRFWDQSWVYQQRSMIFERALELPGSSFYSRESDAQRGLLDFLEGSAWTSLGLGYGPYGFTTDERTALKKIRTHDLLPTTADADGLAVEYEDFLAGTFAAPAFGHSSAPWRVTSFLDYDIAGWDGGSRGSFMDGRGNSCKTPTPGMFYAARDDGPLSDPETLYMLYPYPPGVKDASGEVEVETMFPARTAEATNLNTGVQDQLDDLPAQCDRRFEIHLRSNAVPVVQRYSATCGQGSSNVCLPPAATNLLGHWDFESLDLGTDTSGAGRHGTAVGTTATATGRTGGETALLLSGAGQISIPHLGEDLDNQPAVTVEGWVKVSLHTQSNVFRAAQPVGLWSDRFMIANYGAGTGWYSVTASPSPPLGTWYHVAGVFDQGSLRIYVDGVLAGSKTVPVTTTDGSSFATWALGARELSAGSGDQPFVGEIDDIKVYTRVLSDEEIERAAGICP